MRGTIPALAFGLLAIAYTAWAVPFLDGGVDWTLGSLFVESAGFLVAALAFGAFALPTRRLVAGAALAVAAFAAVSFWWSLAAIPETIFHVHMAAETAGIGTLAAGVALARTRLAAAGALLAMAAVSVSTALQLAEGSTTLLAGDVFALAGFGLAAAGLRATSRASAPRAVSAS